MPTISSPLLRDDSDHRESNDSLRSDIMSAAERIEEREGQRRHPDASTSRVARLLIALSEFLDSHTEHQSKLERKQLPKGEVLINKGERPKTVYLLLSGSVRITFTNKEGGTTAITRDAPTVLGEISLITNETTATVTTDSPCDVIALPAPIAREALNSDVSLLGEFHDLVRKRLEDTMVMRQTKASTEEDWKKLEDIAQKATGDVQVLYAEMLQYLEAHPEKKDMVLRQSFERGEPMIREGGAGIATKHCYILLSGSADAYKWSDVAQTEVYIGHLSRGNIVGEMSLLDESKSRVESAIAQEHTDVLLVRQELLEELTEIPAFRDALVSLREKRLGKIQNSVQKKSLPSQKEHASVPDALASVEASLRGATATERQRIIGSFNETHKHPEYAWSILHRSPEGVIMIDDTGKLRFQAIDEENARSVLAQVKLATHTMLQNNESGFDSSRNGYELRMECLRRDPHLPAHEAFTWGAIPPMAEERDYILYVKDTANWLPQRKELHDRIEAEALERARDLSKRVQGRLDQMRMPGPAVILMKGNTGAGKSSTIRSKIEGLPQLGILDDEGNPTGALNPDEMKNPLRAVAKLDGKHTVSHHQEFGEGAGRAFNVMDRAFKEKFNIVLDKRFCTEAELNGVFNQAKKNGYKTFIVFDVDADGETSLNRVFGDENGNGGRSPDGDDPIVPVEPIVEGFKDTRASRPAIIQKLKKETTDPQGMQCLYYLLKTDHGTPEPGKRIPPKLIASLDTDGSLSEHDADLFEKTTTPVPTEEIRRLKNFLAARAEKKRYTFSRLLSRVPFRP